MPLSKKLQWLLPAENTKNMQCRSHVLNVNFIITFKLLGPYLRSASKVTDQLTSLLIKILTLWFTYMLIMQLFFLPPPSIPLQHKRHKLTRFRLPPWQDHFPFHWLISSPPNFFFLTVCCYSYAAHHQHPHPKQKEKREEKRKKKKEHATTTKKK